MSADNTVVILQTWSKKKSSRLGYYENTEPFKVYRVFHTQAWDNFDWYKENQPYNVGAYLLSETKNAPVYTDFREAFVYASFLYEEYKYVEYGIHVVETEYYLIND